MIELSNVLVATDFGESSDTALRYGRALARSFGATLYILHVVDDVFHRGLEAESPDIWAEAQREAEDRAARRLAARVDADWPGEHGERGITRVSTQPAQAIVAYAREAAIDLIVMGTHGPDAVAVAALGSVAESVVRTAPCPVLTVKYPEREFVRSSRAATAAHQA